MLRRASCRDFGLSLTVILSPAFTLNEETFTLLAIDLHMAMRDQLACRTSSVRETEAENDVVEPSLEKLEQGFARDATSLEGSLEDSAKLLFQQAVLDNEASAFRRARLRSRIVCGASLSGRAFPADSSSARAIWRVRKSGTPYRRAIFVLGPVYLAMATMNR